MFGELQEHQILFERQYPPFLPLSLLADAAGRSVNFTGSFALFRSPALVEVAAEPIDQPRDVFVGSLNGGEPRSGGKHERRQQNRSRNYQCSNDGREPWVGAFRIPTSLIFAYPSLLIEH